MSPEFEIAVHWSDREPPVVSRMGAGAVRDLVALLAASVPDELPAGRVVPATDDPWSLLLGLQAFYRTVLAGDGAVAVAGADGGLWTIPVRQVQGVRVRMVPAEAARGGGRARPGRVPVGVRRVGVRAAGRGQRSRSACRRSARTALVPSSSWRRKT